MGVDPQYLDEREEPYKTIPPGLIGVQEVEAACNPKEREEVGAEIEPVAGS